jgi:predicted GNAT family acetyltransferase
MLALATTTPAMMPPVFPVQAGLLTVRRLGHGDEAEVLAFLAARPIHTVIMAGMIRDNGLVSSRNRGAFYGCRGAAGHLEGVALIGHIMMFETQSDEAVKLFAELAQTYHYAHVILGEHEKVERFWDTYGTAGQSPRLMCRELLFEQRWPLEVHEPVDLRLATLDDIEQIIPVHAQMAFDESGINPIERDAPGFRKRVAHRIEMGRTWVWTNHEKLIFKADVVSDTPEQIYLEGIYTNPEERGKGFGLRAISQLSRTLLASTRSLCVLVNEKNRQAHLFYQRAGYKLRGYYDTIYLQQ